MKLTGPRGETLYEGVKKQFDNYKFKTAQTGTYTFCFSNEFSTFSHKLIYFEFQAGEEAPLPGIHEHITAMTQVSFYFPTTITQFSPLLLDGTIFGEHSRKSKHNNGRSNSLPAERSKRPETCWRTKQPRNVVVTVRDLCGAGHRFRPGDGVEEFFHRQTNRSIRHIIPPPKKRQNFKYGIVNILLVLGTRLKVCKFCFPKKTWCLGYYDCVF